jgi:hypothetical protein
MDKTLMWRRISLDSLRTQPLPSGWARSSSMQRLDHRGAVDPLIRAAPASCFKGPKTLMNTMARFHGGAPRLPISAVATASPLQGW